jgi:hypothetical protein
MITECESLLMCKWSAILVSFISLFFVVDLMNVVFWGFNCTALLQTLHYWILNVLNLWLFNQSIKLIFKQLSKFLKRVFKMSKKDLNEFLFYFILLEKLHFLLILKMFFQRKSRLIILIIYCSYDSQNQ